MFFRRKQHNFDIEAQKKDLFNQLHLLNKNKLYGQQNLDQNKEESINSSLLSSSISNSESSSSIKKKFQKKQQQFRAQSSQNTKQFFEKLEMLSFNQEKKGALTFIKKQKEPVKCLTSRQINTIKNKQENSKPPSMLKNYYLLENKQNISSNVSTSRTGVSMPKIFKKENQFLKVYNKENQLPKIQKNESITSRSKINCQEKHQVLVQTSRINCGTRTASLSRGFGKSYRYNLNQTNKFINQQ